MNDCNACKCILNDEKCCQPEAPVPSYQVSTQPQPLDPTGYDDLDSLK